VTVISDVESSHRPDEDVCDADYSLPYCGGWVLFWGASRVCLWDCESVRSPKWSDLLRVKTKIFHSGHRLRRYIFFWNWKIKKVKDARIAKMPKFFGRDSAAKIQFTLNKDQHAQILGADTSAVPRAAHLFFLSTINHTAAAFHYVSQRDSIFHHSVCWSICILTLSSSLTMAIYPGYTESDESGKHPYRKSADLDLKPDVVLVSVHTFTCPALRWWAALVKSPTSGTG